MRKLIYIILLMFLLPVAMAGNLSEDKGDHNLKIGEFYDNFNDNTEDWEGTGTGSSSSGRYYYQSIATGSNLSYNGLNWSNYTVSADVVLVSDIAGSGTATYTGLYARYNNYGRVGIRINWNDNSTIADKSGDVSYNTVIPQYNRTMNLSQVYNLKLKVFGSNISFWMDGYYMGSSTYNSANNATGRLAVLIRDGNSYWDNFTVRQLDNSGNVVTSGNFTSWKNQSDGNVTGRIEVNVTTPAGTSHSNNLYNNATGIFIETLGITQTDNQSFTIINPVQDSKLNTTLHGTENTTSELVKITYYSEATPTYAPSITSWNNSKVNNNDDTEVITGYGETYYHLVKTFTFTNTFNGNMNISFDMKSGNENNANAQVRKNGVLIGSNQSQSGDTYVTKNQDINVGIVNVSDTIELWLASATAGYGYARNFRLLYDNANVSINTDENINFNATANQTITTWNWYVNGTNQNINYDNISLSYSTVGTRLIQINATNSNGTSNTISWNLTVLSPSTKWTYGIDGDFFQNSTIGSNKTCINQGDGAIGICKLADNFNDNNTDGWNETGNLNGTWLNQNGVLNQSTAVSSYQYWNLTSYENMSIFTKFKEYGNLSSYIDASDLRGNLSRPNANPSWLNCQFTIGSPTQTRAYIYCYNGSSWLVVNNTANKIRYLNEWNYAGFFANGTYFRGYLSNVSYSNAMTSILSSGTSSQWLNGTTIQFGGAINSAAIVSWDEIRAVELDTLGNQYTQGNYSMNYTVPTSQYAKNITINGTFPADTNYSLKYRQNATGDYIAVEGVKTANTTIELSTPYYQSIDILLEMNSTISDTLWITNISVGSSTTTGIISIYNTGYQYVIVNDTMTNSQLNTIWSPTWIIGWNSTSQRWETYKSGWPIRLSRISNKGDAVGIKITTNKSIQLTYNETYNWTLVPGWNLIGIE